jgi:hypothetical protein
VADQPIATDAKAAAAVGIGLAVVATLLDEGTVGWLLSPVILGSIIYAMARIPLRYSLMAMMFAALVLENPSDQPGAGVYHSPLFQLGALLMMHLNNTLGPRFLIMSGMDILIVTCAAIAVFRHYTGSTIDSAGRVATPKEMVKLVLVSFGGILYMFVWGWLRGGATNWALWQLDRVMYLPMLFMLFHLGLRGPKDLPALAKVLIWAALIKAVMAMYISWNFTLPPDPWTGIRERPPYGTTHHDSMLFACAFVLLVSLLMERTGAWAVRLAMLTLPVLILGMIANNRRMVWVQIAMVFLTLYLTTPANPTKRKIKKILYVLAPFIAVYLAAGWNSSGGIFKPAAMVRSVVEPSSDSSSLWREWENYDLVYTARAFPITGMGYGHPYWEIIALPAVSYNLEPYCPHNSILGIWAYGGYIGFTALTISWVGGAFFAMRAYRNTKNPVHKAAALTAFGAFLVYWVQCYGDLGLGTWTGVYLVAPAMAMAAKLAVASGAWPTGKKASAKNPNPIQAAATGGRA